VLSSAGRLVAEGEWNPARRVRAIALDVAPALVDESAVVVGLHLGEAIPPEGPTHVRVSSSPAGLSHSRDVAERFALGVPLSERAVHELVTAVQEAVLNCVRWAYPAREGPVYLTLAREAGRVRASVRDRGVGFDVGETFQRTTGPGRDALRCAGRGLTLMHRLADRFELTSRPGRGTNVVLEKFLDEPAAGRVPHGEAGRA
jgi:stage II sporulation protein AB (anti-sigma F factor)